MSFSQITDDIPNLGPNGIIIQNGCDTKIKVHNVNYLWVIHDFNFHKAKLTKGEFLQSPIFYAATQRQCKWYLKLHPNGTENSRNNDSALSLHLDSSSECKEVFAHFKFSILNEIRKKEASCVTSVNGREAMEVKKFESSSPSGWGCDDFISPDYKLPSNKKVKIYCEVLLSSVDPLIKNFDQFNSIELEANDSSRLKEDLAYLLKSGEFADVVISVKNRDFRVHKNILAARSPVFAAMFQHEDMEENIQDKVNITDFNEQVVEEMLNYIYTDKSENLENLQFGLLPAAEKYGLDGLKKMCEKVLIKSLSLENAVDMLLFADQHNADNLKSNTISYIVAKSDAVMKTVHWKDIIKSNPQLVAEVCEALSDELIKFW